MKEEEVDRYFKDKFQQFAPVPSSEVWARLQSKMEPPRQKRSAMWVYYAAAAVTLLLVSGVLLFWFQTGKVQPEENLARLKPVLTQPNLLPPKETIIADINTPTIQVPESVEPISLEKANKINNNASTSTSKPVKKGKKIRPGILVAAVNRTNNQQLSKSTSELNQNPIVEPVTPAVAQNEPDASSVNEDKVMEIIIKKDPVTAVAYTNEEEYPTTEEKIKENISKKGRLVKNIFKQARNLKNGEKVELSELGINANYRIDVESKLLKHKYSKVINL